MLSLTQRTAKLNQDHAGSSDEKDGKVTRYLKFGLEDVPVDENELGAITGEPHAYRSLYNTGGAQPLPYFRCFKPLELLEDVKGACVEVRLHGGTEFKLTDCHLSKIRLMPFDGGVTLLSCKVECESPLDKRLAELVKNFGEIVDVTIHSGATKTDQVDLPLSTIGTNESPETGDAKPRGRKGKGRNGTHAPH